MVKQADHPEAFLLDSSACILVLRGQASFKALPPCDQTAISSIVAAELWTGAEKSGNPIRFRQLEDLFSIYRVLDFGPLANGSGTVQVSVHDLPAGLYSVVAGDGALNWTARVQVVH